MNRNFMEQREYDMLYRNRRETLTSSEEEESSEEENEEKKIKYSKSTFNFLIDTCDRDWTGLSESTFNFQVRFGNSSDTNEQVMRLNSEYNLEKRSEMFFGTKTLSFPINVKNIQSISVHTLILPRKLIYLGNADYINLLDYRYILVCIEEISNSYYGTNSNINKAIAIMYPLSVVYKSGTEPKNIEFIDKGRMLKEFKPAPLNTFNSLKFTLKDSNGNVLKFKNDILNIKKIHHFKSETPVSKQNFLKIETIEYFNGEYADGDIVKFKNITSGISKFDAFLNRDIGHKIYIETTQQFEDTNYYDVGALSNIFYIMKEGEYNSSGVFTRESYNDNIIDVYDSDNSVGKILNTNLQLSLLLKIDTKIIEFNNLNSQII